MIKMLRWIMLALLSVSFVNAQTSPSLLWKARALEGAENLKALYAARLEDANKNDPHIMAKILLETGFAMHLLSESTVHKSDDESDWFHVLLNDGNGGIFDLVYIYTKPAGTLIGTRIDQLPKNWKVVIPQSAPTVLMIQTPGPDFAFGINDPFSAFVVE